MKRVDKLTVRYNGAEVGTLSQTPDNKLCLFEYSKQWLVMGFSISPLELPLKPGLFIAKPEPFYGNFGIFEDSLPDGYGRYMLHKVLLKEGIDDMTLSSLDRLSIIGNGGMGALTYEPCVKYVGIEDEYDFDTLQKKAFEVLQDRQDTDAGLLLYNSGNSGGCRPKAIFSDADGHWLVKFRHTYDDSEIGRMEYRYNEIAQKCGINVSDFKLFNEKYFASRRFDITSSGERVHVATAGALLGMSLSTPVLDYINLLSLTGYITQNRRDVEEMFRRMVFNYLTDNKDDHCKNFSFMVVQDNNGKMGWRLAPAYDLTLCVDGYNGEHATSVNGKGNPTIQDFIAVAAKVQIHNERCREIIRSVYDNCGDIRRYNIEM